MKRSLDTLEPRKALPCASKAENDPGMLPLANTGIVTNDYRVSYEGINLMARHNIPFVVLRPVDLEAKRLDALDMLVVFSGPSLAACGVLGDFAKQGGIVVLVNLRGDFPWHSSEPFIGMRSQPCTV